MNVQFYKIGARNGAEKQNIPSEVIETPVKISADFPAKSFFISPESGADTGIQYEIAVYECSGNPKCEKSQYLKE